MDSCLYRKHEHTMMTVRAQLLVTSANVEEVLKVLHDSAHGGGHLGVKRSAEKISKRCYRPHWRASVTAYCKEHQLCDQPKQPSTSPKTELVPSSKLSPTQRIEIGVLGGLPMTHTGKRYILVACDTYTKYMQALPMRSQMAQETGMALYRDWFTVHGVPERVHSAQSGNFESMLCRELATLMGCKKTRTTAYHPAGSGDVERNNRFIIAMLKNYV